MSQREDEATGFAFLTRVEGTESKEHFEKWIVDSVATNHYSNNEYYLHRNLKQIKGSVWNAELQSLNIKGKGKNDSVLEGIMTVL